MTPSQPRRSLLPLSLISHAAASCYVTSTYWVMPGYTGIYWDILHGNILYSCAGSCTPSLSVFNYPTSKCAVHLSPPSRLHPTHHLTISRSYRTDKALFFPPFLSYPPILPFPPPFPPISRSCTLLGELHLISSHPIPSSSPPYPPPFPRPFRSAIPLYRDAVLPPRRHQT